MIPTRNLSQPPQGTRNAASLLWRYAGRYSRQWIVALTCTALASITALLQPWPMKYVIDLLTHAREGIADGATVPSYSISLSPAVLRVIGAAFAGVAIYIAGAVADAVLCRIWIAVGQRMVYDLSQDLFSRIQRRSLLFHAPSAVGDLMGRVLGDSWCIYKLLDSLFFSPLRASILVAGMSLVMYRLSPTLMGVSLITAPLMAMATLLLGRPVRSAGRDQLQHEMQVQSHVQRSLAGLNVIQAFSQEQREHERFIHFAGSLIRARQKSALLGGLAELFSGLTNVLGTAVVLYVGSRQVLAHQLSLGELLVFVAYLATLQLQFKSFAATFIAFQTVGASIDRVRELLNSPDDPPQRPGAIELAHVSGRVEIEDAWFGYAGESAPAVLRGVSIRADVGSRVAIVGPTGAGKSTLLALIPRLFDPQKGRVLIDGHDIRELTIDSVRRAIAMVPQDPVLLPISIAQNIAFAAPEASMEQIICAARAAEAHEFIEKLPMGYDTIVGQRGSTLSGGQRQRIAIARAFVKEAPIVLMDEPTSGLDALTESSVLTAMNRLMQGRTVLVIAHRLSTIRSDDLVVVLENGVIAEQGSHDALLAGDGLYAKYHAIQFASSSDAAADAPALLGVSAVGG